MAQSSYIQIKRSSSWFYRLRKFDVVIDDQKVGSIGNGKEERFEVSPGLHAVELRVSWIFKSQVRSIHLEPEQTVLLEAGCPIPLWQFSLFFGAGFLLSSPKLCIAVLGDLPGKIFALLSLLAMVAYSVWLYCRRGKFLALTEPKLSP